jgi:hypothetical protein
VAGGRGDRNKRSRPQGGNSGTCPVHPNSRHSAADCREIIKLAKRVSERRKQSSKDDSPPRRRPSKERANEEATAAAGQDLEYQSPEGDLKDVFTRDFDSGDDNDRRKKLYVMCGGSWELTSHRNVKSLRREVLSVVPGGPQGCSAPMVEEHHHLLRGIRLPRQHGRGRRTAAHHRPCRHQHAATPCADRQRGRPQRHQPCGIQAAVDSRVPAGALSPILRGGPTSRVSPREHHAPGYIWDRGKLSHGERPVRCRGCQPPLNAIIGRLALYRFMAIAHYGYLILKMPSPVGVLAVRGDRAVALAATEKLHALAAEIARPDDGGRGPSTFGAKAPSKEPKVQPSRTDDGPAKTI